MSAPVTEAHRKLVAAIIRDLSIDDGAQLIADSEARAVAEWQDSAHLKGAAIDSLLLECDRLRADVERLTAELEQESKWKAREYLARAERAEAELKEWSLLNLWGGTPEIVHAFVKGQQARIHAAQDVEAELAQFRELAAERARLDWLEENAKDIMKYNCRSYIWFAHQNIRAAIDAAMKEDAK